MERRRCLEERIQYDMRSREAVAAANVNLAPPFRTGTASFATSAAVANKLANPDAAPDAADVMTGAAGKTGKAGKGKAKDGAAKAVGKAANAKVKIQKPKGGAPGVEVVGKSQHGGSSGSTDVPVLGAGFALKPVAVQDLAKVPPKRRSKSRQRDT